MADAPSKNKLESLKADPAQKPNYVDRYDIDEDKINPLSQVVPNLKGAIEDVKVKPFFGPFVLNIVCITGPYVRTEDDGGGWDDEEVTKCKELIKEGYKDFAHYETHFIIDEDAEAVQEEDNEEAMEETEELLEALCDELEECGFTYHGRKDTTEIATKIDDIIKEFKEAIQPKND